MSWETFRQEAGDWAARKWFGGHYKEAYGTDAVSLEAAKAATDADFYGRVENQPVEASAADETPEAVEETPVEASVVSVAEAPVGVPVAPVDEAPAEVPAVEAPAEAGEQ